MQLFSLLICSLPMHSFILYTFIYSVIDQYALLLIIHSFFYFYIIKMQFFLSKHLTKVYFLNDPYCMLLNINTLFGQKSLQHNLGQKYLQNYKQINKNKPTTFFFNSNYFFFFWEIVSLIHTESILISLKCFNILVFCIFHFILDVFSNW